MFIEWMHDLWLRLKAVVKRRQLDRDLAEELEFHLAMREQKLIEQGMSPREAHYAARRGFGNVVSLKETSREMWGFPSLETLLQDVHYGLRILRRSPGFTAVAVLTLALGIGGTTAIFSVVYCALLNPYPYKDSDRLAVLVAREPSQPRFEGWAWVSPAEFLDLQEQNHVFDQVIGGHHRDNVVLTGRDGLASWLSVTRLTPNTVQVLGMSPIIGRGFNSDDARPGAPPVVLLNYKTWQSKFGGNPGIVGQTIFLNRQPTTVIGVMPPRFEWSGSGSDCWLPALFTRGDDNHDQRQTTPVVGHLKVGATIAEASAEITILAKHLVTSHPKEYPKGVIFAVKPLTETCAIMDDESGIPCSYNGHASPRRALSILMGGVGLLLLIACVNVANLLLARATGREKEFAVRASLGASRLRLVRQLMIESLLLAFGGCVLGSLLAWNGLSALVALIPPRYMPTEAEVRMNGWVMLFAVGMALLSTVLFGLAPAVLGVRKSLQASLKASGRGSGESRSHNRLRDLLVVSEVILSLVLLSGGGMLLRSFWVLRYTQLGYNIENVLWAETGLSEERYKTAEQRTQFYFETLRRVRALPGVVSAAIGWPTLDGAGLAEIEILEKASGGNQRSWFRAVDDRFFETLDIPLLQGRAISDDDLVHARPVVVVNRAFANKYFAGKNPLGHQIKVKLPDWFPPLKQRGFEIVGVVADTRHADISDPTVQPQIFLSYTVLGTAWNLVFVRTAGDPSRVLNPIRHELAAMDKELPIEINTARDDLEGWYTEPRFVTGMLVGFAALGMTLVCIGVYSVLSYSVSQRTHEIGVRMALGAQAAEVRSFVLRGGLRWLLVGISIGVPASIALAKILQNRIWGIKTADPLTLVAVLLVLTAVGLAACYIPARRATKVDPMVALRYE